MITITGWILYKVIRRNQEVSAKPSIWLYSDITKITKICIEKAIYNGTEFKFCL